MDLPPELRTSDMAELLQRQAGLISAAQLGDAGLDPRFARRRVAAGRWQRSYRGVYATFSGPFSREAQVWAALLVVGPDAVASHATAAELDGLTGRIDDRIHVTSPATRRIRGYMEGVVVHYAHRLAQTRHPAKCPPRTRIDDTVLDLIDSGRRASAVEGFVTMAVQKRLTTTSKLAAALMRRKRIRWRAMIEAMLVDVGQGAHSPLELQHLRNVEQAHRLPTGRRQRRRAGERVIWVDVEYEAYNTRVELDGRLGHEGEGRFRDRRRDNNGTVHRAWTLRYGHAEIFGSPCDVAIEQARVLSDRGWNGEPAQCGPGCAVPSRP